MVTKSKMKKKAKKGMLQSIRQYVKVLSIAPDDIPSWNALGILFGNFQKYDRSVKCLQKVISLDPEDIQAHHNLGTSYGLAADHETALEYFKKSLELEVEFAPAWCNSGVSFTHLGQPNEAAECFRVCDMLGYPVNDKRKYIYVICDTPSSVVDYERHASRGDSYFAKDRYAEAIQEYVAALRIHADDPVVWLYLGMAFARISHYKTAIKCYHISVKLNPDAEQPWGMMGLAYSELGKSSKALQCYEKALQVNPDCSAFKLLKDLITDNYLDMRTSIHFS